MAVILAAVPAAVAFAQDATRDISLSIAEGVVSGHDIEESGGLPVLRITQGTDVEIHWSADRAAELHLHGYDVEIDVEAGSVSDMLFTARFAGRFALEMHGAQDHGEATLLYVEVRPK